MQRFTRLAWLLVLVVCLNTAFLSAQSSKKGGDTPGRSVQGVVSGTDGSVAAGAVVQLKNVKTLQIRSFITQEKGEYFFNGLSQDVDYELQATSHGVNSATKTLSSFDSRKQAVINLKLEK
jgi:hypothetical protein